MQITISQEKPHYDDVIKWKQFPRYWPFVLGIHRSPVNSLHKGQWRGALMFPLICGLNKWLSKQSWGWWFETPSHALWCHCNANIHFILGISPCVVNIIIDILIRCSWYQIICRLLTRFFSSNSIVTKRRVCYHWRLYFPSPKRLLVHRPNDLMVIRSFCWKLHKNKFRKLRRWHYRVSSLIPLRVLVYDISYNRVALFRAFKMTLRIGNNCWGWIANTRNHRDYHLKPISLTLYLFIMLGYG